MRGLTPSERVRDPGHARPDASAPTKQPYHTGSGRVGDLRGTAMPTTMTATKDVLHHTIQRWNAHDREGWADAASPHLEVVMSGGEPLRGQDGAREVYDIWTGAFPDNRVDVHLEIAEGPNGLQESHFRGTHTGTMRTPAGDIPATGKPVDIPFVALMTVEDGKMASFRVYFDTAELMRQLGIADA